MKCPHCAYTFSIRYEELFTEKGDLKCKCKNCKNKIIVGSANIKKDKIVGGPVVITAKAAKNQPVKTIPIFVKVRNKNGRTFTKIKSYARRYNNFMGNRHG